jgi:hypothetical protein
VDTNVPVVANGAGGERYSIPCRIATVSFLRQLLDKGTILLDLEGEIQAEYHRYLNPHGQPGVGDRFYLEVINSAPDKVERIALPRGPDGEYLDLPQSLIDTGFDPSDRKFAALARREGVPVYNAVDSDWIHHAQTVAAEQIEVEHLCGCDPTGWFTTET